MATQKTPEEIEQLKTNWAKDPCWDIEDTEGFEAHREELIAWRKDHESKMEAKWLEAENERIEKVMLATGVGKAYRSELLALHTFEEIENCVAMQDKFIGHVNTTSENIQAELMQAQVRATLLQAAQLKRIADALESMADGDSLSNSVKIWGTGL